MQNFMVDHESVPRLRNAIKLRTQMSETMSESWEPPRSNIWIETNILRRDNDPKKRNGQPTKAIRGGCFSGRGYHLIKSRKMFWLRHISCVTSWNPIKAMTFGRVRRSLMSQRAFSLGGYARRVESTWSDEFCRKGQWRNWRQLASMIFLTFCDSSTHGSAR